MLSFLKKIRYRKIFVLNIIFISFLLPNVMASTMDDKKFWEIVDKSIVDVDSDTAMAYKLANILVHLQPDDIAAFQGYIQKYKAIAYKKELYGAAQLLNGTILSDDGYDGFTNWLITRGKKAYEAALLNADSLVEQTTQASAVNGVDTLYGDFCAVPYYTYKVLTGKKIPFDHKSYGNPPDPYKMKGYPLTAEELQAEYPLLWKRFGKLYLKNMEAEKNYKPDKATLEKRQKQQEENEALIKEIEDKKGRVPNEELYELERRRLIKLHKDSMELDPKSPRLTDKEIEERVQMLMDGGAYHWIYDDRAVGKK